MPTPRKTWPEHVDGKRLETQQLADDSNALLARLERASDQHEKKALMAQIRANNERIARLMIEAKHEGKR